MGTETETNRVDHALGRAHALDGVHEHVRLGLWQGHRNHLEQLAERARRLICDQVAQILVKHLLEAERDQVAVVGRLGADELDQRLLVRAESLASLVDLLACGVNAAAKLERLAVVDVVRRRRVEVEEHGGWSGRDVLLGLGACGEIEK